MLMRVISAGCELFDAKSTAYSAYILQRIQPLSFPRLGERLDDFHSLGSCRRQTGEDVSQ